MEFITYEQFKDAMSGMPMAEAWTLEKLLKAGMQKGSLLPYCRSGSRTDPPVWRRDDAIAWFSRRYQKMPCLVQEFTLRLQGATSPIAKRRKTKAGAAS